MTGAARLRPTALHATGGVIECVVRVIQWRRIGDLENRGGRRQLACDGPP
jgi:hypothetical protein